MDLTRKQKQRLTDLLFECPSVNDRSSRHVLEKELPFTVKGNDDPKVHALNMVNACLNHANGLDLLVDSVKFLEGETIQYKALAGFVSKCTDGVEDKIYADTRESLNWLPYLVNRADQEFPLCEAVKTHNNFGHPLICLVHGYERECSDKFFERIQRETLSVRIKKDNVRLEYYPCDKFSSKEELHGKIRLGLGVLCGNRLASLEEIAQTLAEWKQPVILWTEMESENRRHCKGIEAVKGFLEFWEKWPKMPYRNHLLLAGLSFRYNTSDGFWNDLWHRPPSYKTVRNGFNDLKMSDFNLSGVVLPELKGIEKSHVEDWVRVHAKKFCAVDPMLEKTKLLFKNQHEQIPMERIVRKLKKLLHECE
ncbi:MAG: hypothetical protein GY862_30435 [Gammaproteobacteria bacterium]|nr:hypothetical protein [Gammaproteobacteria bacterium]